MAQLNARDEQLLRNPPTPGTWLCFQHAGSPVPNSQEHKACWLCRKPRPRKPALLWPRYVIACKRAGIEPGEKWPKRAAPSKEPPRKVTRRKQ